MTSSLTHTGTSAESSVRALPVPAIDPIEYGRGQLSAISFRSATAAREVHILRLRNSFERARIGNALHYALSVISLMREAQELRDGYWFPTPLRTIRIDDQAILLGSVTTQELQHRFEGVVRAGYARVSSRLHAPELPTQELENWLGLDLNAQDTVAWTKLQIAFGRASMGPTISSASVQYLSIAPVRSPFGTVYSPVWLTAPDIQIAKQWSVAFCRERLGRESFRHFLGHVVRSRLVAEAPCPRDLVRMQFGLAAIAGKPFTVVLNTSGGSVFHTPPGLPRSERQLILALGSRNFSLWGKAFRVGCETFAALIAAKMLSLGCEVRRVRV